MMARGSIYCEVDFNSHSAMNLKSVLRRAAQPFLGRIAFSLRTRARGEAVSIPIIQGTGLGMFDQLRRQTEGWKLDLFQALLARYDGIFVDIGVNLGQTLLQLRVVDADRPYVGFEPNPKCIGYVERLAELNGFRHVELLAVAVGRQCGTMPLHMPDGRSTDSTATLIDDLRPSANHTSQPAAVLSEHQLHGLLAGRKVGIVKIDVEGSELEVLHGLESLLKEQRPAVLCEVLYADRHADLDQHHQRQQGLTGLLNELGFAAYRINKSTCGRFVMGLERVYEFPREIYSAETAMQCDYLFLPAEHENAEGIGQEITAATR